MRIEELRNIMENSKANRFSYSINSSLKDDAYHIIREDGVWNVFYMERGKKNEYGVFKIEEEACKCFYEIIKKTFEI